MLNFYLLRENENIQLLNLLKIEYIREEFMYLINNILRLLPIDHNKTTIDYQKLGNSLILIINKILLDNLYRKIADNQLNQLIFLIQNKLFCKDLYIRPSYIYDLYNDFTDNKIDDYTFFEAEYDIKKILENYISYIYNNNSDKYNEVFIKIINMFLEELSWVSSNNFKIEILYRKVPALRIIKV